MQHAASGRCFHAEPLTDTQQGIPVEMSVIHTPRAACCVLAFYKNKHNRVRGISTPSISIVEFETTLFGVVNTGRSKQ